MSKKLPAVIFDIDGTLADTTAIGKKYINQQPIDWESWVNEITSEAQSFPIVVRACNYYSLSAITVFILTARREEFRQKTLEWLDKFNIRYSDLLMRKNTDLRHDEEIKKEHVEKLINHYHFLAAYEDKPECVEMFKSLGIYTFNCNQEKD